MLSPEGPEVCLCGCDRALTSALLTAPGQRNAALMARLDAVAGRVPNAGA